MHCGHCGKEVGIDANYCPSCGRRLKESASSDLVVDTTKKPSSDFIWAGFWRRAGAYTIDYMILYPIYYICVMPFEIFWDAGLLPFEDDVVYILGFITTFILVWLYFALLESSQIRGTIGKMVMKIAVVDLEGQRISFARATGRYFAKFLSALTMGVGFIMVAFTYKRQGLHDILTECLVVRKLNN